MPALCLLFDAHWWANWTPPPKDEPQGGAGNGGRGKVQTILAKGQSDDALMGAFN